MNRIPGKFTRLIAVLLLVFLLGMLAYALNNTYEAYTRSVVEQRQEHLLITARAVSQNLSLYLSEQLLDVDIFASTPGFLEECERYYQTRDNTVLKEYVLSYLLSQQSIVARMYLFDREGNEVFHYNHSSSLEEFDESVLHLPELCEKQQSGVGTAFRITNQHYGLTLVNAINCKNSHMGTIVTILDMRDLYRRFVAPLDIQRTGIIIVKNHRGTVIMHPDPQMLTFNYFQDIDRLETLAQYESLRKMLVQQYTLEEGTAIYDAYSNGISPPQEEIAAFSRMNLGETAWYVSAVIPYSQVTELINENMGRYALLVAAIFLVVFASILMIYGLQKNRQKLQMETSYLRNMNRTLEELHQSREQVWHYQKLQTLGALAGGIVHEFNNLLTPIMGYSEFLKDQMGPDSVYYEDMDEIYKAGARAKEIVDQILPYSRKETDSTTYGVFSIDAVIHDATKMVRMILPATTQLRVVSECENISVYGSATQINQVLLNLCTNAYQALEPEGGVITVKSRTVPASQLPEQFHPMSGGTFLEISVSDTGCGIAPEVLPHIFDSFFTTKAAGEGTGLGLSVVQNILVSHGGYIQAESALGEGSRFTFYLPVTQPTSYKEPAKQRGGTGIAAGKRLLLVDDDATVVHYLKMRLQNHGYAVQAYTDSEEALRDFLKDPNLGNAVILDDTMPKLSGTALAQEIKYRNPSIPVILITGLVNPGALLHQKEKLIDEILRKPLDFTQLLQTLEALLPPV